MNQRQHQLDRPNQADLANVFAIGDAGRGDANHLARIVDRQTAGVAVVDFRVGLEPFAFAIVVLIQEARNTALGEGDGVAADARKAEHADLVADLNIVRVANRHHGQAEVRRQGRFLIVHQANHLENRHIEVGIGLDHARGVGPIGHAAQVCLIDRQGGHALRVIEAPRLRVAHHMEVGDDVTLVGHDRARAGRVTVFPIQRHSHTDCSHERSLQFVASNRLSRLRLHGSHQQAGQ